MLSVNDCVLCDISFVFILFLTTLFLLKDGWTALHYAAYSGYKQILKILIEHGSNVHLQTKVLIFFFLISFCVATVDLLDCVEGFGMVLFFFNFLSFYCVSMGKQSLM